MAARQTVAMFAAHAAAEFNYEIRDLVGHIFHDLNVPRVFSVYKWPYMETSHACMTVVTCTRFVFVNNLAEPNKEFRKFRRLNGAILHKCDRLPLAFHAKEKAQTSFPYFPDAGLFGGIEGSHVGVTRLIAFERGFHRVEFGAKFGLILAIELHQEKRCWIAFNEPHQSRNLEGVSAEIDDHVVDQLDRRRFERQNDVAGPD